MCRSESTPLEWLHGPYADCFWDSRVWHDRADVRDMYDNRNARVRLFPSSAQASRLGCSPIVLTWRLAIRPTAVLHVRLGQGGAGHQAGAHGDHQGGTRLLGRAGYRSVRARDRGPLRDGHLRVGRPRKRLCPTLGARSMNHYRTLDIAQTTELCIA